MNAELYPPFFYFGGKRKVADVVWRRLGNVDAYIEPFAGSLAVLLARPGETFRHEIVNDINGYIANFWRAAQFRPDEVAQWADWPINENDLHARHKWLLEAGNGLAEKLEADPDYCDPKIAGWWLWGTNMWIGSGWCLEKTRKKPSVSHLRGSHAIIAKLGRDGWIEYMHRLSRRIRHVRVLCGDWSRALTLGATSEFGSIGVFLDPPYDPRKGVYKVYSLHQPGVSADVREWAIAHGSDPKYRIALCGYEGEHEMPPDWSVYTWRAGSSFQTRRSAQLAQKGNAVNRHRERIWFSPYCHQEPHNHTLFS